LKFHGVKRLSIPLAGLISSLVSDKYDAIIPVPLHTSKLREREFNQTALIGHHLSKALSTPLITNALCKNRETKLQTDVSGKERRDNLRGAFSASGEIGGISILLVDDVITTGATVTECSRVLKKAGALKIDAVALARSMPRLHT
jgi:ComF family protein